MTVELAPFAAGALFEEAEASDIAIETLLEEGVLYYFAERDSRRTAWRVPRLAAAETEPRARTVELALDEGEWDWLRAEAARQNVTPARLAQHAALLYLSDLDTGRIGLRIVRNA